MTIPAFGNYVNTGGQILDKGSISYAKYTNVDSDLLREFGAAAATNPFITGCNRFGADATGVIATGRNNPDAVYCEKLDLYF